MESTHSVCVCRLLSEVCREQTWMKGGGGAARQQCFISAELIPQAEGERQDVALLTRGGRQEVKCWRQHPTAPAAGPAFRHQLVATFFLPLSSLWKGIKKKKKKRLNKPFLDAESCEYLIARVATLKSKCQREGRINILKWVQDGPLRFKCRGAVSSGTSPLQDQFQNPI